MPDGLNRTDVDNFLYSMVSYRLLKYPNTTRVEDVFQAFRYYYADWPYFDDPVSNRDMMARVCGYNFPQNFPNFFLQVLELYCCTGYNLKVQAFTFQLYCYTGIK